MKAELKTKWLEALRSGEYKQCQGSLTDNGGGYCCLGVLAKVAGLPIIYNIPPRGDYDDVPEVVDGIGATLDEAFEQGYDPIWGLLNESGSTDRGPVANHVIEMNDKGLSFKAIAKYLEVKLPEEA